MPIDAVAADRRACPITVGNEILRIYKCGREVAVYA
jgi:hypothetical protein